MDITFILISDYNMTIVIDEFDLLKLLRGTGVGGKFLYFQKLVQKHSAFVLNVPCQCRGRGDKGK